MASGFNSRAPRGARQPAECVEHARVSFNSRAPRGARRLSRICSGRLRKFQFTCPSRSTTCAGGLDGVYSLVSIHVPLAEHDHSHLIWKSPPLRFNSRAPRGARRQRTPAHSPPSRFNSRTPRGARLVVDVCEACVLCSFNSRAPRGARLCFIILPHEHSCFNSRAPRGARQDAGRRTHDT